MKVEFTHVEIRRVQNGFVVQYVNYDLVEAHRQLREPQRTTLVAKDVSELATMLESTLAAGDLNWLPSSVMTQAEAQTMIRRTDS